MILPVLLSISPHKTCVFEDFEILFDFLEKPSKNEWKKKKIVDFEIWIVPMQKSWLSREKVLEKTSMKNAF